MFKKLSLLALLVILMGAFSLSAFANVINVAGTYTGTINGGSINATSSGSFDNVGADSNSLTVNFSSIPSTWHPFAIGVSIGTIICWGAAPPTSPNVNLFTLTGGNYTIQRKFTWPSLPGDSVVVTGSASTSGSNLSYSMNLTGNYSGPTDLVNVLDYTVQWRPITGDPTKLQETGSATILRSGGGTFTVNFTTTYSGLSTPLTRYQRGTLIPVMLTFNGSQWYLNWKAKFFKIVPSLTAYGLIILALLLTSTAIWLFRKRLAVEKGGLA